MSSSQLIKNIIVSVVAVAVVAAAWQVVGVDNYIGVLAIVFIAVFVSTLVSSAGSSPATGAVQSVSNDDDEYDDNAEGREVGVVKFFNVKEGWGFITRSDGEDVFVHFRNIRGRGHRSLNEGQRVTFSVGTTDKGLQAEDVAIMRE